MKKIYRIGNYLTIMYLKQKRFNFDSVKTLF